MENNDFEFEADDESPCAELLAELRETQRQLRVARHRLARREEGYEMGEVEKRADRADHFEDLYNIVVRRNQILVDSERRLKQQVKDLGGEVS